MVGEVFEVAQVRRVSTAQPVTERDDREPAGAEFGCDESGTQWVLLVREVEMPSSPLEVSNANSIVERRPTGHPILEDAVPALWMR